MAVPYLDIQNLTKRIGDLVLFENISFSLAEGERVGIIARNGAGKSTLSSVLAGDPSFTVSEGEVNFHGVDLLELAPENRSHEGLFLSFQYPVEIPGVSMVNFMRAAINAKRKYFNQEPLSASDFLKLMRQSVRL